MTTLYLYRIKTLDGRTVETVAPTSADALQQTGIDRENVRPWYPFALAVVPPAEEQAEASRKKAERLAYIRDQLGHHSIQITVDTYGHLVPGGNRQAVDRLDDEPKRQKEAASA